MNTLALAALAVLGSGAAAATLLGHHHTPPAAGPAAARVPVVVELFTSEGCSSCPAADAVLRELVSTQPVPGVEIIALGEHVDYWNRLGWADPFSQAQFTQRQQAYATGFAEGNYTPQAVVAGRYELVGSRRAQLLQAVAEAARAPRATVQLAPVGMDSVRLKVSNLPAGTKAASVWLALTETGLTTQVGGGENAGRLLRHAPVVRSLRALGTVAAGGTFAATAPLGLAASWPAPNVRVVALVQATGSLHLVGAASLPLVAEAAAN
ncbi:DUF1223 domain-containing protein [Hymenobacter sp. RP-2-7]|uniref:DUF1223 domain-containing protein n=1 Tax=Hymenobacter polaris TaxID=2682546 RepID=A0A7Y0ADK1_9BACT|nr:DUF1223 domain-containing protein [Hymenobacter polaris]NML65411.1 DUF1223 domain-containing protein [Hymenobacter polaris]